MTPNDIQRKIRHHDQRQPLNNRQLVRDLGVYLRVRVVRVVEAVQHRNPVEGEVDEEEEGVVEEEGHQELEDDAAAGGNGLW